MDLEQYKEAIRKYRGHLKSCDGELEEIFNYGCHDFKDWTLSTKAIGVHKMAYIAINMNDKKQQEFVVWVTKKKRTVTDIDMYILKEI